MTRSPVYLLVSSRPRLIEGYFPLWARAGNLDSIRDRLKDPALIKAPLPATFAPMCVAIFGAVDPRRI